MYDQVCRELDVSFRRAGQYVCFDKGWMRPFIALYCLWRRKHDGIEDTRIISGTELKRREPNLNRDFKFAVSNPSSGCVCPYGLTIAYGENAVQNGAQVSLSTAVLSIFTSVRAPTFEEDFIIEKGRNTKNIIHCAGIQSPGLTTAPAVVLDIEKMAVEELRKKTVVPNERYSPIRHGVPVLREMPDEERSELIRKNPDYGVIVCRCKEVGRGEILDALCAPICVPTVDGVKKRVRPGMGRCQGGFCSPLVAKIIAEFLNVSLDQVKKSAPEAVNADMKL